MSETTANYLLHLLGFAGFLWIGLYVLARGDRGPIASLTGLTALVTACYFFFNGLSDVSGMGQVSVTINRIGWWTSVLPATLWLHLSLRLNPHAAHATWRMRVLWVNYALGVALVVLGTVSDLLRDYHHPVPSRSVVAGPLFPIYIVYLVAAAGFAAYNLSRMGAADPGAATITAPAGTAREVPPAALGPVMPLGEVRLMVAGATCFVIGAGYIAIGELPSVSLHELPAYVLLLVGLGAVGVTVALRSALLLGKDLRRDFLYSFTNLLILVVPSIAVLGAIEGFADVRHGLAALLLIGIFTTGYTLYDTLREQLDKVFFTPVVQEERAAARAYEEALATQPAGPNPELATRKAFDDAVRRALTHLSDPTKLATSPLLNLQTVGRGVADQHLEDNRLNRAAVLKEILVELLDGLRPADRGGVVTADASRYYNCLYYPYVRGLTRRRGPTVLRQLQERRRRDGSPRSDLERVIEWLLQVDEDTFYKWQRRGSDTIAAALREREATAGEIVASDAPGGAEISAGADVGTPPAAGTVAGGAASG
jgi:hypothetical protein